MIPSLSATQIQRLAGILEKLGVGLTGAPLVKGLLGEVPPATLAEGGLVALAGVATLLLSVLISRLEGE